MERVRKKPEKNIHRYDELSEESKIIIDLIWPEGDYPKGSSLWKSAKSRGKHLDEYLVERFHSKNPRGSVGSGGHAKTEEQKKFLSDYWKGKKKSEEHTLRIRAAKAGEKNPMYGKERPQETIDKYRETIKGRGFLGVPSYVVVWWKEKKGNENVVWSDLSSEEIDVISKMWEEENRENVSQATRDRRSVEYKIWRRSVFERDNYTCYKTGKCGGQLHAHHIWPFSIHDDLRFATFNGITLCKEAHEEFHSKYGKQCTLQDLETWTGKKLPEGMLEQLLVHEGWDIYEYEQSLHDYDENGNYYWDD